MCIRDSYDYYYSGSGRDTSLCWHLTCSNTYYYFLEDNNTGSTGYSESNYFAFMPQDQQSNQQYYQYGVFWLYNWFQAGNNNMDIYFLMNGNILNYSLALEQYNWGSYSAYAIPPMPPGIVFCPLTGECEPIFAQSYINAYNTAFNQETSSFNANYQKALNKYRPFTSDDVNSNFIPGTFGFKEGYIASIGNSQSNIIIDELKDDLNVYTGIPYLFVSAGSGGGSGFMYLNWVIVAYGVPYAISLS